MDERMTEAANWILIVGLATACSEAVTAWVERSLDLPPRPLPMTVTATPEPEPRTAELGKLLSNSLQPASKSTQHAPNQAKVAAGPSVRHTFQLKAVLHKDGKAGVAVLEHSGKLFVLEPGREILGLRLLELGDRHALLKGPNGSVRLALDENSVTVESPPTPLPEEPVTAPLTRGEIEQSLKGNQKGARLTPWFQNGQARGVRVELSNLNHILARLGLQNGDLVLTLNGKQLEGAESLTVAYRELLNSSTLRFEVERAGQIKTLLVHVED